MPVTFLPRPMRATYWPYWANHSPVSIPVGINTVYLAFAIPNPSGTELIFGLDAPVPMAYRIAKLKERGVCVILSVGGAGETIDTAPGSSQMASLSGLCAELGVDGVDWDIEGQSFNTTTLVSVSRALRSQFGGFFNITISAAGNDYASKDFAAILQTTNDLRCYTIQYYDYPNPQTSDVISRMNEMSNDYGIPYVRQGFGVKYTPGTTDVWPIDSLFSPQPIPTTTPAYTAIKNAVGPIRGVNLWDAESDRLADWKYANWAQLFT